MKIRSALFCSLLAAGTAAHAEGFYVLGSVGQANAKIKDFTRSELNTFVQNSSGYGLTSSKLEDSDTGYKLQVGYQFTPNLAVEGGYVDLGKIEYKYALDNGSHRKLSYDTNGWNLEGVVILPVNAGISFLGKFGAVRAKTEFKGTNYDSHENTKVAPVFGLGLAWNIFAGLSVRAEWERYYDLNKKETTYDEFGVVTQKDSALDIDLYSVGVSYQF